MPVAGSVLPDGSCPVVPVPVAGALLVVVPAVVLVSAVAGPLVDELLVLVEGVGVGAGLVEGLGARVEVDDCDVLDEDWLCPLPASGSTYCWSPAEGPVAKALAGASTAAQPRTIRHTTSVLLTGRTSMAPPELADSLSRGCAC